MNTKWRRLIAILLLLTSILLSFAVQKGTKYVGTTFISDLKLPYTITDWQGKDVKVGISEGDDRYNFIGEIIAREYINKDGEGLLLLVLNARDFHYPNLCFTSSGFEVKELEKAEFQASGRTFKVNAIFTQRTKKKTNTTEQYLIIYWIVIDKKFIPHWVEQKLRQLYFSLFNKKDVGLMVRIDVPIRKNNIEESLTLAKQFVSDFSQTLSTEQADYVFGKIR